MKQAIDAVLKVSGPIKARTIAKRLGISKGEVNAVLYRHPQRYEQYSDYSWILKSERIQIILPATWVTAYRFEEALRPYGSVLSARDKSIAIVFPKGCKPMIESSARLLALSNQLVDCGHDVLLDFSAERDTQSYLNRAGFLDILNDRIHVKPNKGRVSLAKRWKGKSATLVEFGEIRMDGQNSELEKGLTHAFVQQASEEYEIAVFTVFSELIGNVYEHSQTRRPGFAGLQCYKKGTKPHIQAIVSDSGIGIARTLRPVLEANYPGLFQKYGSTTWSTDMGLVTFVMKYGDLSRRGKGEGGSGFTTSRSHAKRFVARYSVRQQDFCLDFHFQGQASTVRVHQTPGLVGLEGTHICFDFSLG